MLYFASPYTSPDPAVMQERYEKARDAVLHLYTEMNTVVFSPILHFHAPANELNLPKTADFYMPFNEHMIAQSDGILIYTLTGWALSTGLRDEYRYAKQLGKPILFLTLGYEITAAKGVPATWRG